MGAERSHWVLDIVVGHRSGHFQRDHWRAAGHLEGSRRKVSVSRGIDRHQLSRAISAHLEGEAVDGEGADSKRCRLIWPQRHIGAHAPFVRHGYRSGQHRRCETVGRLGCNGTRAVYVGIIAGLCVS